jgi:trehalose 6-phosphate synthase
MIKEKRPDARVAIFWHIPWPNPEAFGICPWQRQLVDGLLGADLIGFHVQSHCNNFLQTVDRTVESRVDWEHFSVLRQDHRTIVRPFPISVDLTDDEPRARFRQSWIHLRGARSFVARSGRETTFLNWRGPCGLHQGNPRAASSRSSAFGEEPHLPGEIHFRSDRRPSRTHIKRYHDLLAEVEVEADRSIGVSRGTSGSPLCS